jgi:hypothetical protein
MSIVQTIFMRGFGRPRGILGRLGGMIMARIDCGAWVTDFIEVGLGDRVLEVGFRPGIVFERLAKLASSGRVAGIDQSQKMVSTGSQTKRDRNPEQSRRSPVRFSG